MVKLLSTDYLTTANSSKCHRCECYNRFFLKNTVIEALIDVSLHRLPLPHYCSEATTGSNRRNSSFWGPQSRGQTRRLHTTTLVDEGGDLKKQSVLAPAFFADYVSLMASKRLKNVR